jgi:hypothetical protein
LCAIEVDLRNLPLEAFERSVGQSGVYYSLNYELVVVFDPVIEFKLFHQGSQIERAMAVA